MQTSSLPSADEPHASAKSEATVVIIGGGPAGLTAAYELAKAGVASTVLEKDSVVGGISRTATYKGYKFDIVGHRFFTKVKSVEALWHEILGPEDFLKRPRLSRIYYSRRFFAYPIKPLDALAKLGVGRSFLIVLSYIKAKLRPIRPETTFEQNVINRFGRRLYDTFFRTYTEKVWGMKGSEISAEWANQRINSFGLGAAIKTAIARRKKARGTQGGNTIKTLIEAFHYPRQGPGMMWERVTQLLREGGNAVEMHTEAVRLRWSEEENGRCLRAVTTRHAHTGQERELGGTHFISSMPVRELIEKMEPPAPEPVRQAAQKLAYRDFLTVALVVERAELFPDNWIYIHDPDVRLGRIQNFKNWSEEMVPDPSKTCLGLEYFCFEGDDLWSMADADLIELGKKEVEILGLAKACEVSDGSIVRMPKAYPVYDAHYKQALETVREWTSGFSNLQLIGRNGMHRYNNQDHSMLTAMLAAQNILGARYDLWSVNEEQEYHEEIQEDTDAAERALKKDITVLNSTQPLLPNSVEGAKAKGPRS